jgi:hypothetical protein
VIEGDRNWEKVGEYGVIKHTSNGRLLIFLKIIVHKAKDERRLWQRHWLACHSPYSVVKHLLFDEGVAMKVTEYLSYSGFAK